MIGPIKTIGIYVADPQQALSFYTEKLGFVVRRRLPLGPKDEWIEISPPDAQTSLVVYPRSMMPNWHELKPSAVFYCPDVAGTCRVLKTRGVRISTPPKPMPWGTFAMFADPDGNEFGLTSQEIA